MANQLDEKAPREKDLDFPTSASLFNSMRRDVFELAVQLDVTTKLLAAASNGRSKAGDEARELVARINREYGIPSPE